MQDRAAAYVLSYLTLRNGSQTLEKWQSDTCPDIIRVALYSLRTDHAQKTWFHRCVRNIAPRRSRVTPSQYCRSVTSCACVEMCLPSRNLETDCVTPLFHCWCVYYLKTTDFVAQLFLHGSNMPQYVRCEFFTAVTMKSTVYPEDGGDIFL
jgi:hypothetical protein